jgi:alkylation response protein AidB-like acyl-CoA dehydrogenase
MNHLNRPDDAVMRARALRPAIEAAVEDIERTKRIPEPLLGELHRSRLLRMLLPRSAGGDELEPWTYLRAVEEIGRADASIAWNMFVANSSALIASFLAPEAARAIFDDPRTVIAWGPPNGCQAKAVPGGYRVSGRWSFASGCRAANWMGAHCQVVEPDGSLRPNHLGRPAIRTLLFPVEQAVLEDTWHTIGLRGTASDSYSVTDLFVPEAFSTTREDPSLRRDPGRLYAFPMQGIYAVGVCGVALGCAREMLESFRELAGSKVPRGLKRLADNAVVQSDVARNEAKLGAAHAYLSETLHDIWDRVEGTEIIAVPDRARVRLACAHAIQAATEVADYAYKAAGTDAIVPGSAFERRFRDIHTAVQQIQGRTAHFEAVGQIMFGMIPDTGFL